MENELLDLRRACRSLNDGSQRISTFRIYGVDLGCATDFGLPLPLSSRPPRIHFELRPEPPFRVDDGLLAGIPTSTSTVDGDPVFTFAAVADCDVVRVANVADYFLYDEVIVCHLRNPRQAALVPVHLFGMVLSLWLERRGVLTLHASAVATSAGAVAVLAAKGVGKTTLSAALVAGGGAFLTDDLLALPLRDNEFWAEPAYPQLRMTLEQAAELAGTTAGLDVVNPTTRKYGVPVERFGRFTTEAVPLRAAYLPARSIGDDPAVMLEPLSPRSAFLELVRHTFLPKEVADLGLQRGRFERLTRLASAVPFRRVVYPSGHAHLPRVVAAILGDNP